MRPQKRWHREAFFSLSNHFYVLLAITELFTLTCNNVPKQIHLCSCQHLVRSHWQTTVTAFLKMLLNSFTVRIFWFSLCLMKRFPRNTNKDEVAELVSKITSSIHFHLSWHTCPVWTGVCRYRAQTAHDSPQWCSQGVPIFLHKITKTDEDFSSFYWQERVGLNFVLPNRSASLIYSMSTNETWKLCSNIVNVQSCLNIC